MKRIFILLLCSAVFVACGANAAANLFPQNPNIAAAPARVRQAYEFAMTNPDALKNVPCYCGCNGLGHKNNYACYIKDAPTDSAVMFDEHAIGCQICVDITQDVMRLTRAKKSPQDIRAFIVEMYSDRGPSTDE